jgi:hypothetical protein
MKFTREPHLKMASILLRVAREATGKRKLRLESLAHAGRLLARRSETNTKSITTTP